MRIGINNWVLSIDYLQNVKVIPYWVFFTVAPKHLHNLMQLMEMGKHMLKKLKIYIDSGCRVGLYSNKQISYQGQSKVIAKSNNSSSYIKQLLRNSDI